MRRFIVIVVLIAAGIVGWLYWNQGRTKPLIVSGFVEADEIRVGSRVGGRVSEVLVDEGGVVKIGQPLFKFAPFDLEAQLAEARSQLAAYEAERDRLKAGYRPEEIEQAKGQRDQVAAKLAKLTAIGLDVAIHTRGADFAAKVKEATGGNGADVIVNLVGGSQFAECLRCLARHGRLAVVGYVDGSLKAEIDLSAVHVNRLEIFGISNARLTPDERAAATRGFVRDVVPAFADGRMVPVIDRVFAFDDMPAAKACMESSAMVGKIVVRVSD